MSRPSTPKKRRIDWRFFNMLSSNIITLMFVVLVAILLAILTGFLTVVKVPRLDLQVSPPGYPEVGGSWNLLVLKVNFTSGQATYAHAGNATVVVDVLTNTQIAEAYVLSTDDGGEATFTYLARFSEVSFQAFLDGYQSSDKVMLNEHYVSPGVVDTLLIFDGPVSILGTLGGGLALRKKKVRRYATLALFGITCLFSFVTVFSVYSKLFQGTNWGYPEKIVGDLVTFTTLKYVLLLGMTLFLSFWVVARAITSSYNCCISGVHCLH